MHQPMHIQMLLPLITFGLYPDLVHLLKLDPVFVIKMNQYLCVLSTKIQIGHGIMVYQR